MLLTKIYVCSLVSPVLTTCLLTVSLGLFCCCFLTKFIITCQLHTCIQWNRIRFILIVLYSWPSSLPTCPLSQLHGFFFANKKYFLVIHMVLHWIMGSLPVVTPLKKNNSLSPCSYQLTTAPQLGVVTWQVPLPPMMESCLNQPYTGLTDAATVGVRSWAREPCCAQRTAFPSPPLCVLALALFPPLLHDVYWTTVMQYIFLSANFFPL